MLQNTVELHFCVCRLCEEWSGGPLVGFYQCKYDYSVNIEF